MSALISNSRLHVLLLALFTIGLQGCVPERAVTRQPNFLFILVDDLGYMDVGFNNPRSLYETPNLDRLAASGMRFTDGYAASPVCSPTRYSIMTGKYPTRVGATDYFSGARQGRFMPAPLHDAMPLEETTLAEALREQGYSTFFAGKWHLGPSEEFWPENQGFDVNRGGWSAGGPYGGKKYFSPYENPRLDDGPDGEHLPARLASETVQFIEQNRDRPFLAYLSFYSVHTPLIGREDLVEKYEKKIAALGLPGPAEFGPEEQVWPDAPERQVRLVQAHAVYAAMVEAMDAAVGRVLDRLEELGIANETVVFFMSDNGGLSTSEGSPTSNLPLRGGKGWLYEGGIREPFVVRWPGVAAAGSACGEPVMSIDFYPTILEIAGVGREAIRPIDGVSLVPLLRGGKSLGRESLFWHYPHYSNQGGFPGGAVRSGKWKLVERFEDGRIHLFDLESDISEHNDLAAQETQVAETLRIRLHEWYDEVGAQFLRAKPEGPEPWRPAMQ